jgi:hypothetical protein
VKPNPNVDAEFLHRFNDGGSASDGVPWILEARKEAIACGVDLPAAVPAQLASDQGMVARQQDPPPAISKFGNQVGGANDVGEQKGREDALATTSLHALSMGGCG